MHKPAASIVIPSFNSQDYLPRCIDSARRQTCENIQIVCVDNGSTDDSMAILEHAASEDARIKVLRQPETGVSCARNLGIDSSEGRYVLFLDADDFMEPQTVQTVCDHAACMESQMTVYSFDEFYDGPEAYVPRERCPETELYERAFSLADCKSLSTQIVTPNVWRIAFDREFLSSAHLRFDPSLRTSEDLLFIYQCLFRASRIALVPDVLYHYRRTRSDSLTRKDRGNDGLRALEAIAADAAPMLPEKPWIARHLTNMVLDTLEYQIGSSATPDEFRRLHRSLKTRWLPLAASHEDLVDPRYVPFYQLARSADDFECLFELFQSRRNDIERLRSELETVSQRARMAEAQRDEAARRNEEILASRSWRLASSLANVANKTRNLLERS